GPVRHALPGGGRRLRGPHRAGLARAEGRRRDRGRGQGDGLGPDRAGHAGRRGRRGPGPGQGRGLRRDPRRYGDHPLQRQRLGGQVPAQRHPGPGPGDHHPWPGGRLPRPDRRRGRCGHGKHERPAMTSQPLTADLTRHAPPAGGFNLTLLRLEIRRLLRNRRTVLFTMVLPVFFFLLFGLNSAYANLPYGSGNVSAQVMINLALYGAVLATTSGGAMVAIERSVGWSRQLRITPLSPVAYIGVKMLTAM